jgi:hypothetical protein
MKLNKKKIKDGIKKERKKKGSLGQMTPIYTFISKFLLIN